MSESEAGTSSNANEDNTSRPNPNKNVGKDMKKFSEAIKSAAEQQSQEDLKKYGLMVSKMFGNVAEALELGEEMDVDGKRQIAGFCTLLGMAKGAAAFTNEGNGQNGDGKMAEGLQQISQLFGNVTEEIPDGPFKVFSDMVSSMHSGIAENVAMAEPSIGSMAGGLLAALKCVNKYPKPPPKIGQKANKIVTKEKDAKQFVKEVAKIAGGISQLFVQFCDGPMNTTVQNMANGQDALVQSAHIQGAKKVSHVNLHMKIQDKEDGKN